jgi:hypothetical protein
LFAREVSLPFLIRHCLADRLPAVLREQSAALRSLHGGGLLYFSQHFSPLYSEEGGEAQRRGGITIPLRRPFNRQGEAMKLLPASKPIPAWQIERAKKIHRACLRVQSALARGEKITRSTRRAARYYHHKNLKSDPSRRLLLSGQTLRRLFELWKNSGQVPSVLIIKYRVRRPNIPAPLLIRFVDFCAGNRLPSVKEAWRQFSTAKRNARQTRGISYGQVCYSFPAVDFYLMQAQLKTAEKAQRKLTWLRQAQLKIVEKSEGKLDLVRLKVIEEITASLPQRTPHRLTKNEPNFEV